ncbi:MAG TPA: VWA domain-containing protein [Pyrinomonadaceae bacterium]|nr:VWA domain-containing protein [Pyrinomonadaceae bacterium]
MLKALCAGLLKLALVFALVCACAPQGWARQKGGSENSLTVALPAGANIQIENRRGGVAIEVWGEDNVAINVSPAANLKPSPRRKSASPVRIERTEETLAVSVPRASGASASRIDLKISVPARARVRVTTSEGEVVVRGLPAALSAQTISGDLKLDFPEAFDADITAQSLNGAVALGDGIEREGSRARLHTGKFQTRRGAGTSVVNLFSGRGRISLAAGLEETARAAAGPGEARGSRPPAPDDITAGEAKRAPVMRPPQPIETPQEVEEDDVVRVESDLVTLNVSVVDRANGRGITNLTLDDFKLYEDGAEQQLAHFEAANAPFDLVLLIDLSGSTAKVTDVIRAAALRFIAAARTQDRIAVVTFAGVTNVVSPLTTDRQSLRAAISRMERPNGDTRLHDALASAMEFIDRDAKNSSRRRAIILMSDGLDSTLPNVTGTGSTLPYEELRSRVQEFDGVLYTIWTSTEYEAFSPLDIQPETFDLAHDRMSELAEAGGGVFYEVERLEDLGGAYERVVEDLGTVYSLSYRPANKQRDGRWRAIRIRLPRYPNAVARGKRGYNAN